MGEEAILKQGKRRNFLYDFLKLYPHVPSQALWRALEARLFSKVTLIPPVLDLGCGDGSFTSVLIGPKGKIEFGCDLSKSGLAEIKKLGIYHGLNIADARHLPYRSNSFATVISNCVLEHISPIDEVLSEVARVLIGGGSFFFTVPSDRFCPQLYFYKYYRKHDKVVQADKYIAKMNARLAHLHYHSLGIWKILLTKAGLVLKNAQAYLSPSVEEVWDKLLAYTTGLAPKTNILHSILTSKRLLQNHFCKRLAISYFELYLRRYWMEDINESCSGGALFVEAIKPRNKSRDTTL